MLASLFAVLGLLALRIGLPVVGILLISELLHYVEARWNSGGNVS